MKIVVQKNHLGGLILYRSLVPPKKRRQRARNSIFKTPLRFSPNVYRNRPKGTTKF